MSFLITPPYSATLLHLTMCVEHPFTWNVVASLFPPSLSSSVVTAALHYCLKTSGTPPLKDSPANAFICSSTAWWKRSRHVHTCLYNSTTYYIRLHMACVSIHFLALCIWVIMYCSSDGSMSSKCSYHFYYLLYRPSTHCNISSNYLHTLYIV